MRWIFAIALVAAGCARPIPVPPPSVLVAPTITGVYSAPLAPRAPAAAVPMAIYYGYPDSYGVMLCMTVHDPEMLCWYPPPGAVTVK